MFGFFKRKSPPPPPARPAPPRQSGPPLVASVLDYSERVLPALLDGGAATSALAPWMLGAALSSGGAGAEQAALEGALGLARADAARELAALLARGPTALRSALAFWCAPVISGQGPLGAWEATLPEGAARGPVPSQAEADAWTREKTEGLIESFPVALRPDTLCALGAAIVARVRWDEPLDVVTTTANGWGLKTMLAAEPVGVFETPIGLVGVARSIATAEQLGVYSFIADPGAPRAGLVSAALAYVRAGPLGRDWPTPVSPAQLPKQGHAWTVVEDFGDTAHVPAFEERVESADIAALPGVREAVRVFQALTEKSAPSELLPIIPRARMSALARYHRLGFEAAAVAAMSMLAGGLPQRRPTLQLRFTRPHLVLAVATDPEYRGLPLFAAWVDKGVREADA